jgi:uncharacterized SAM-binding protein YcdF (DUF218 family)
MDWFTLRKALAALVLPPTGPLIIAIIGLALLGRRPRLGRGLAWLGVVALFVLSLPIVSHGLLRALDPPPALDLVRAREAQAIVILGGGVRPAPEFGGETLGRLSLERVRYGARVARETKLPVLVTGGTVFGGTAEATLMKLALEKEFGVPVRWTEDRSRDTRSNATESAGVLLPLGVRKVILVAHGFDFPRASAEFGAAGFDVIPAPTVIAGDRFFYRSAVELLPSMSALYGSYYALYELLADAVRATR